MARIDALSSRGQGVNLQASTQKTRSRNSEPIQFAKSEETPKPEEEKRKKAFKRALIGSLPIVGPGLLLLAGIEELIKEQKQQQAEQKK